MQLSPTIEFFPTVVKEPTYELFEIVDVLSISDLSLIPALLDLSSLNNSKIVVNEEYGSFTFISVVDIFSVGSKSFETIVAEASVE